MHTHIYKSLRLQIHHLKNRHHVIGWVEFYKPEHTITKHKNRTSERRARVWERDGSWGLFWKRKWRQSAWGSVAESSRVLQLGGRKSGSLWSSNDREGFADGENQRMSEVDVQEYRVWGDQRGRKGLGHSDTCTWGGGVCMLFSLQLEASVGL